MFERGRKRVAEFLADNLAALFGGRFYLLQKAMEKQSKETLEFNAAIEQGRIADGRQMPNVIVPRQPRRSAAEERRRIDERPVP